MVWECRHCINIMTYHIADISRSSPGFYFFPWMDSSAKKKSKRVVVNQRSNGIAFETNIIYGRCSLQVYYMYACRTEIAPGDSLSFHLINSPNSLHVLRCISTFLYRA